MPSAQITLLLQSIQSGDTDACDRLWRLVQNEVYRIAQSQAARDGLASTLHPTVLVQEAYLRLMGSEAASFENRRHFFAAVAESMRRIRVDAARSRRSLKRGGGAKPLALDDDPPAIDADPAELLAIHDVLDRFAAIDPDRAQVVKLRYFAGLSVDETADAMGVSPRTVDNYWQVARAWLHRELSGDAST
jgi:RNA polymerase sigma factor (TIGR02999 family)